MEEEEEVGGVRMGLITSFRPVIERARGTIKEKESERESTDAQIECLRFSRIIQKSEESPTFAS